MTPDHSLINNPLLLTDSYKLTHWRQYPPDTEYLFSYFEPRTGGRFKEVVFFGLQHILKTYLAGEVVTEDRICQAERIVRTHLGDPSLFNWSCWDYIRVQHHGRLPVKIFAPPEGSVWPEGNPLIGITNTDPRCAWLVNYLETLLVQVWYPITVATLSRQFRKNIARHMLATCGHTDGIEYKLHDFGFRGVSSVESAGIGGAAHLVNFHGTDTLAGLAVIDDSYGGYSDTTPAHSIPASEHSTITSWGAGDEAGACHNMLRQYPSGLVACVSDSYDLMGCIEDIWGDQLRNEVLDRPGTLVIRPDSGNPITVLPECLVRLWNIFGGHVNQKGYRTLDEHVRLIWGDGIDIDTGDAIMEAVAGAGFSIENVAFGMGGGLLQKVDRDTQRCAFKASAIRRTGQWHEVRKQPKTDPSKSSRGGVQMLLPGEPPKGYLPDPNRTASHPEPHSPTCHELGAMTTVFENGTVHGHNRNTFDQIRKRAQQ